jgi:RHS repeat-associated protein
MESLSSLTRYLCLLLLCWISTTSLAQDTGRDEIVFFFNDAQGSAVAAVNESGDLCWREEYTPYGDKNINDDLVSEVGCGIIGEERGFTGHTEDVNSDLVYMQQRYYDPGIGRFLSVDPLDANPNDPRTYNRYAYGYNNPYKYVDPDGRAAETPWDATNVGIGLFSAAANLMSGNYLSAAVDLGGAVVDAAATLVPGVPGGVATVIQSNRAARLAAESIENVPKSADESVEVFRVFGGDARAQGFSWTTVDPRTVDNFRDAAGLPSGGASGANNTADFLLKGTASRNDIIKSRDALPLDGNSGGLPELIIDPANVDLSDFSVLRP